MLARSRYALTCFVLAATASLAPGCDDSSDGGGGGGAAATTGAGCIQGVVVNGLTSERAPLKSGSSDFGVFVLVRNRLLQAQLAEPDPTAATANPHLIGEYNLCGLPVDEDFPMFVWIDGFQSYEGIVHVPSTAAGRSPVAQEDIERFDPIELVNVRVWPKNQDVKDLEVFVNYDGAPLANAIVTLRAVGANFLGNGGGDFNPPLNVRSPTLRGTSDAAGRVVFPATDLVLGGHYTYTVLPPEGGANQTAIASELFVLGLRGENDEKEPYRLNIRLMPSITELTELSRSSDSKDPDPSGKLVIYFNREIEIVPGIEDSMLATLSGPQHAALADNVPGNNTPETMIVRIEGNKLTLEPVWKTTPHPDPTVELPLAITYSNVKVRPKTSPHTLTPYDVTGATVQFYR